MTTRHRLPTLVAALLLAAPLATAASELRPAVATLTADLLVERDGEWRIDSATPGARRLVMRDDASRRVIQFGADEAFPRGQGAKAPTRAGFTAFAPEVTVATDADGTWHEATYATRRHGEVRVRIRVGDALPASYAKAVRFLVSALWRDNGRFYVTELARFTALPPRWTFETGEGFLSTSSDGKVVTTSYRPTFDAFEGPSGAYLAVSRYRHQGGRFCSDWPQSRAEAGGRTFDEAAAVIPSQSGKAYFTPSTGLTWGCAQTARGPVVVGIDLRDDDGARQGKRLLSSLLRDFAAGDADEADTTYPVLGVTAREPRNLFVERATLDGDEADALTSLTAREPQLVARRVADCARVRTAAEARGATLLPRPDWLDPRVDEVWSGPAEQRGATRLDACIDHGGTGAVHVSTTTGTPPKLARWPSPGLVDALRPGTPGGKRAAQAEAPPPTDPVGRWLLDGGSTVLDTSFALQGGLSFGPPGLGWGALVGMQFASLASTDGFGFGYLLRGGLGGGSGGFMYDVGLGLGGGFRLGQVAVLVAAVGGSNGIGLGDGPVDPQGYLGAEALARIAITRHVALTLGGGHDFAGVSRTHGHLRFWIANAQRLGGTFYGVQVQADANGTVSVFATVGGGR